MNNWGNIRIHKQALIDKNNQNKNKNSKQRNYRVYEKEIVSDKKPNK